MKSEQVVNEMRERLKVRIAELESLNHSQNNIQALRVCRERLEILDWVMKDSTTLEGK